MEPYDSKDDTCKHIETVRAFMDEVRSRLYQRSRVHDASKLVSPEKEAYDILAPRLKGLTYGSDEYRASLREMKPAIEHHYANNSHHPEHYKVWRCPVCQSVFQDADAPIATHIVEEVRLCPACCKHGTIMECALEPTSGVYGFDLLDLVEMLCDWKAASLRHADGDILKSIEHNIERFKLEPQVASILRNTVVRLGWAK